MEIINPSGKKTMSVSTDFCGKKLTIEVNRVGFRTTSSVLVTYGDTVVLGSVVVGSEVKQDFFPLTMDYEEKFYAAGKISSSKFIKREGKPADEAILVGRLIDRPIRPLFPKGYRREIQCVTTVLSMDPSFRPDVVAMIAASSALYNAGVPFDGPVAALRVGRINGEFKAFLSPEEREVSDLDLVVAVKDDKVMMVEAGANEVQEDDIIEAMRWVVKNVQPALELQKELHDKLGVEVAPYELSLPDEEIQKIVDEYTKDKFGAEIRDRNVLARAEKIAAIEEKMHEEFALKYGEGETDEEKQADYEANKKAAYAEAFNLSVNHEVRRAILEEGVRPDTRKTTEVRPLSSQVGVLPRTHGSSIFTRGLTQAMNIVTLAPLSFAQLVDTMEVTDGTRRYMHHYDAPGYTVGEISRLGAPGRREVGHGYLAERALLPVLPSIEDFPYAIRSVTEIMSQNGSTSMAATCSSCLALMDAGVPLKRPVSGVAMGLMLEGDTPHVLTDLMDAEDFAGDMDFKVTGTTEGVTALQMDMKVHGLPVDILEQAIHQSHDGRMFILEHMLSVLPEPRKEISKFAPRIEKLKINPDKIGTVIGKGGETINKITSETGAQVDIEEDGLITISGTDSEKIKKALDWVKSLVEEPEVGKIYEGTVVTIKDFGAFVNILPGIDGMLHISQISDKRIAKVEDVLHAGDKVKVRLDAIDDKGRLSLSMRHLDK